VRGQSGRRIKASWRCSWSAASKKSEAVPAHRSRLAMMLRAQVAHWISLDDAFDHRSAIGRISEQIGNIVGANETLRHNAAPVRRTGPSITDSPVADLQTAYCQASDNLG
jgi:hypothetical protein